MPSSDRSECQQAGPVTTHDERDRVTLQRNRTRPRQRQRLGDERIGEVAREDREHENRRAQDEGERTCGSREHARPDSRPCGEHETSRLVPMAERGTTVRGARRGGAEGDPQLGVRASVHDQPERGHLPGQVRGVPRRGSVGDDRAPAGERLQARHAARRVHENVGGCEHLTHLIGETEHGDPRIATEGALQPLLDRGIAACKTEHGHAGELQRGDGRPLEISDRPTSARYDDKTSGHRQPERLSRGGGGPRDSKASRHERGDDLHAPGPCHPLDARHQALVHDEMDVDTPVGPHLDTREVRNRGAYRNTDPAAQSEAAEDRGRCREGRDDHVGSVLTDDPQHRSRPHQ